MKTEHWLFLIGGAALLYWLSTRTSGPVAPQIAAATAGFSEASEADPGIAATADGATVDSFNQTVSSLGTNPNGLADFSASTLNPANN